MPIKTQESNRFLYAIISTVGSSLDLEEVLGAVVRLLTDACSVHACFVYLVEDDRLVLEAASDPYAHLVGTMAGRESPHHLEPGGRPSTRSPPGSGMSCSPTRA